MLARDQPKYTRHRTLPPCRHCPQRSRVGRLKVGPQPLAQGCDLRRPPVHQVLVLKAHRPSAPAVVALVVVQLRPDDLVPLRDVPVRCRLPACWHPLCVAKGCGSDRVAHESIVCGGHLVALAHLVVGRGVVGAARGPATRDL
eukprot:2738396-Prymnesium_polylepis.1